jgi:hypothetical protein
MKNLKTTISTNDIIENIKMHVNATIEYYNEGNETWVNNLRIADKGISMLSLYAQKKYSDFDETWDEIMKLTGFTELYNIREVCDKLDEWR